MAIEVEVNEVVRNEFPKLMINTKTNSIILATGVNGMGIEGVCIKSSEYDKIGEYASNWRDKSYIDYSGEITLKNK